jgi:hypothetical protein
MRIAFIYMGAAAIAACVVCYFVGQRSANRVNGPLPGEREGLSKGLIMYTLEMHRALGNTNLVRLRDLLDTEIFIVTHQYEIEFGVPSGADRFATEFKEAKVIADRLKKELVPTGSLGEALHSEGQTPQPK